MDLQKRVVYLRNSGGQAEVLEADLVIWNAGQAPVTKAEPAGRLSLPFPTNSRGATQTEATLRVLGHPNVFAVGDIAVCGASGGEAAPLPATAQVAFQQADYAAWNVWAAINRKPLLNFSYQHLGDMMSLGSANGAVALPIPIPPPLSSAMQSGPFGELMRVGEGGKAREGSAVWQWGFSALKGLARPSLTHALPRPLALSSPLRSWRA